MKEREDTARNELTAKRLRKRKTAEIAAALGL
jgi:hypothetical protein